MLKVVQGDSLYPLFLQFYNKHTGQPRDISNALLTPKVKFRERHETTNIFEADGVKVWPSLGLFYFNWPTGGLNVEPGRYEIEAFLENDDNSPASEETSPDFVQVDVKEQFGSTSLTVAAGTLDDFALASGLYVNFKLNATTGKYELWIGTTEANAEVVFVHTPS